MTGDGPFRASDPSSLAPLLEAASAWARRAGQATLEHFGTALAAESKQDGTPVTIADREAESILRREIGARYPDHAILGEEFGEEGASGDEHVRWILDPIDGTRSFMRGVPLYAVLIGVEVDGEAVVGVAHFPALDETVAAARGLGCRWTRGTTEALARVSRGTELSDAMTLTTDPRDTLRSTIGPGWKDLSSRTALVRGWGDAYGHILVATGRAEIMVDPELAAWDAAPLLPILSEAGGTFTSLDGRPTIHGGSGVSTNGTLHPEVLTLLSREG